jgi:hypothetical protein
MPHPRYQILSNPAVKAGLCRPWRYLASCEIRRSHSGDAEVSSLRLGCYAVSTGKLLPTFRTIVMYLHLQGQAAQETYLRQKIRAYLFLALCHQRQHCASVSAIAGRHMTSVRQ